LGAHTGQHCSNIQAHGTVFLKWVGARKVPYYKAKPDKCAA
jgi:hypothetical protein